MTREQSYMIWKCTGRCDPKDYGLFQAMRAAELLLERVTAQDIRVNR